MAERRNELYRMPYRTNGAAAYDVHAYRGNAAPEIQRPGLPEERRQPVRRVRVKAKAGVAPFAILGMAAAACMLVLVIFGYVQLYEVTTQVSQLEAQLTELEQQNHLLRSEYEGGIDLAAIEAKAINELGMTQPSAGQNVYLNLSGVDRAEVLGEKERVGLMTVVETIRSNAETLVEYLS